MIDGIGAKYGKAKLTTPSQTLITFSKQRYLTCCINGWSADAPVKNVPREVLLGVSVPVSRHHDNQHHYLRLSFRENNYTSNHPE
jgi:hypothetical protein